MQKYEMVPVGAWTADEEAFRIETNASELLELEKLIYAFVDANGAYLRIGSSKRKLRIRLKEYCKHLTNAINGRKSPSPGWEAAAWRKYGQGAILARQGTLVHTSVGEFRTYLDEESILIRRYKPPLNRSHR